MDATKGHNKNSKQTNHKTIEFEDFFNSNSQLFQLIGLKNAKEILRAVWEARNDEILAMEDRYQDKIQHLEDQVLKYRIDFEKKYEREAAKHKEVLRSEREQMENQVSMLKSQQKEDIFELKSEQKVSIDKFKKDFEMLETKYLDLKEEYRVEKDIWATGMLERDHDIKNLTETLGKSQDTLMKLKEKFVETQDESKENKVVIEEMIQQNISLNRKLEGLEKSYKSIEKALSVELQNRKRLDDYIEKLELNVENRTNSVDLLTKKYESQIHWLKSEVKRLEEAMEKANSYSKKYKEMNSRLSHELMKAEQAVNQNNSQSYF
jgi:hypothetical protein